jgi:FkbM family methyltransferase
MSTEGPRPAASSARLAALLDGRRVVVVDVGARHGAPARWQPFRSLVSVVGFEPDIQECARLNAAAGPQERFLAVALAGAPGRRTFHVCRDPGCSSLYPPNTELVRDFPFGVQMDVVAETTLEVTTLDAALAGEGLEPDVVKLDAQGAELEILQGGPQAVAVTLAIELEVEFAPQYRGQPLFADVDRHLRAAGFALLALRRTAWRRRSPFPDLRAQAGGQLIHGDALYYNEARLRRATDPRLLARMLVVLHAYRQHDFILHLLGAPHPGLAGVSPEDRRALATDLVGTRGLGRRLVAVPAAWLRIVRDAVRGHQATAWHDPGF